MTVLQMEIPGEPVAKQRPRVIARGGKVWTFTPRETVEAERHILACAQRILGGLFDDGEGRYSLTVGFYSERPTGRKWTYDLDNLVKLVLDALTPARGKGNRPKGPGLIWRDDRQVIELHASRRDRDLSPRTWIQIERLP